MLAQNRAIAFIPVRDIDRAMHFYADVLGLFVTDSGEGYCALDAGGLTIRLTAIANLPASNHTIVGWSVASIDEVTSDLVQRGLSFHRYDGLTQDQYGIWSAPNGDRIAWFSDPDANTLSITQFVPVEATPSA